MPLVPASRTRTRKASAFYGLGKLPDTKRTCARTKVSKTIETVKIIVVTAIAGAESANTF
jgi:hypothetical protein